MQTLAALLLVATLIACACAGLPFRCETHGGTDGAQSQLRFIDANEGQLVFTFGPSAASGDFGIPAYTIAERPSADGTSVLRVTFRGASIRHPDGTTSYDGPTRIDVGGTDLVALALASDAARTSVWDITRRGACPNTLAKTYVFGKSPRAQLALLFAGRSAALTLEATSERGGAAPQDTPVQASGAGFAPSAQIDITANETRVWDTTSNADGSFDSGFNIGYLPLGTYRVRASDGRGHTGETALRVVGR